jgi:hypothetical protein
MYGPVGAERIHEWIAQGRVDSRTPVFREGARDWVMAGQLPEFAAFFPTTPPIMAAPRAGVGELPRTNAFAMWGLVCGLLSWSVCCCCGGFPVNLAGLILSIIGLVQIKGNPQVQQGQGMAITGIVLCSLSLLWYAAMTMINLAASAQPDMINFGADFN